MSIVIKPAKKASKTRVTPKEESSIEFIKLLKMAREPRDQRGEALKQELIKNHQGFYDWSEKEYFAYKAMSKSGLSLYADSPEKYFRGDGFNQTKNMEMGTAFEKCLMPDPSFADEFVASKYVDYRTNEAKEWKANQTRNILTPNDCVQIIEGVSNIKQNEKASCLLSGAMNQVCMVSELLGEPFKGMIDIIPDKEGLFGNGLADLKRTSGFSPKEFKSIIYKFKYHWQAAIYLDLWNSLHPTDIREEFYFLLSNSEPPYQAGVVKLSQERIQQAREEYKMWLSDFIHHKKNRNFRSFYDRGHDIYEI